MKRPTPLMQTIARIAIKWTLCIVVLVNQVPQVGAQPSEEAPQAMKPAWLYEERHIGHEGWTVLLEASYKGNVPKVGALLDSGAKIEETDEHGVTPLYAATLGGQVVIMEVLLNRGANVDARIEGGRTPLTGATWKGHLTAMDLLLKRGADVNGKREDGLTPLMQVATAGNLEAGKLLLSKGANVNAQNQDGATALIMAAEAGKSDMLELLLNSGASTRIKMKNGAHVLYFAAQNGHIEVVRQLLNKGMKAQEPGPEGATAIHAGAAHGRETVVRELLERGVNVNEQVKQGVTPLLLATQSGHAQVVGLLLDRGADPNIVTKDKGQSPLEIAALNGHVEIVRLLLHKGARVNSKNLADMTPLLQASMKGHEDIVRLLLTHGADPNIESLLGTPLQHASAQGHVGIVNMLIEKGANTRTKRWELGFSEATTLVDAAKAPGSKALKTLLDQGKPALVTQPSLALALLEVAKTSNSEKVKLLLEKGADANARNVWMQTPLMLAADNGYLDTIDVLVSHGADMTAKDREEHLSATEHAVFAKAREEAAMAQYEEEDKKDALERYDQVIPFFVEAEKSRRARAQISPRLVTITQTKGCFLSTLDPMSGALTPLRTLDTCPDDMFVSDRPGAIILRAKNKLEVFSSNSVLTTSKPISLPAPDKKGWKLLFQIAGQLADGRLAVGYREPLPRKSMGPEWKWTLYAYTKGKWNVIEQKDCLTPSWCLLTPFSGRSTKEYLGDEDWLWHPYIQLNPFFREEGQAEKVSAESPPKVSTAKNQLYGYRYKKFVIGEKEIILYYEQSLDDRYQTGKQRYQITEVHLEKLGSPARRLSSDLTMGALEGKFLLWQDEQSNAHPQLRLLDIEAGTEPIPGLHLAGWAYWPKSESTSSLITTQRESLSGADH